MSYFLYGLFGLFIFFVIINYFRKLHWDAIHNNLFDLADDIGGNVIRKGFLARPVYHGKYKGNEVTINFSQEKKESGRKTYINISLNKKIKNSITFVSMKWLETQKDSMEDLKIYNIDNNIEYGMRTASSSQIEKKDFDLKIIINLKKLHPFNYIFLGKTGVILEKESQNIALDTRHPGLKSLIGDIYNLCRDVQ
ncbi:hypothetical protein ACFLSX_00030 [Calditrichota bacterium]